LPSDRASTRTSIPSWRSFAPKAAASRFCTNKLEFLSVRLLDALKLGHHFAAICGRDIFGVHKPNPEMLRQTVLRAGGEPGRAIMVGDSGMDVRTARAASVPVIAVDFGYSEVPIAALNPDRLIGSFAELPTANAEIEGLGLAKGLVKGSRLLPRSN